MRIEERQIRASGFPTSGPGSGAGRDVEDAPDAHALGVLAVLPGSRVLDVGAGSGKAAQLLAERDCRVWAIDIDPDASRAVGQWCERAITADVEQLDLDTALPEAPFDAILALDVLGHLRDPAAAVRKLVGVLAPGGRFVTSIPNVAHAAVRLQLLNGRFPATEEGLLDHTHLHHFDRPAAEALLEQAGLAIVERLRVRRGPTETEIPIDLSRYPAEAVAAIVVDPDADTYQFILVGTASAGSATPVRSLAAALQARLEKTQDALGEATSDARILEERLSRADADRERLAGALEEAERRGATLIQRADELETALRERLAELGVLTGELRHLQADLEIKDAYSLELHSSLGVAQELAEGAEATRVELEAELARVHSQCKIEAERRAEVEAEWTAFADRAGYRLVKRVERALEDRPISRRVAMGISRLLAR